MGRLSPSGVYLAAYNSLQTFGWALSLSTILLSFISIHSIHAAYASAGHLICWLQTLAFLEVIHSAIVGYCRPLCNGEGARIFCWLSSAAFQRVQELPSVFITFTAWSISEVIRYSQYALNCIGTCPSWLTYLRYTAFIPLYPIGVAFGEMWLMYQALPLIKEKNLYANVFGHLHFSYYSFVKILLICYPFLWLKLYLHLFKQRQSKLGKRNQKQH